MYGVRFALAGGFTLPYFKANLEKGDIVEVPNIFHDPKEVYQLCSLDFVGNFFTAVTIKDKVVNWLDPKPKPYL